MRRRGKGWWCHRVMSICCCCCHHHCRPGICGGGGEDGKGVEDCVSEKGVDAFPEKKSRALYIIHPHHQFDPLLLLPRLLKYYCCSCSLIVVVVAAVLHLPRPTAASTAISNVGEISGGKKKIQNRSDTPF